MDIRGQQYWMSQYGRKIHFQKSRCPKKAKSLKIYYCRMQDDLQYDGLTELIVTETITERKTEMIRRGDAFIAFPGGTGTLEEIAEVMSKVSLKQLDAPCILYNLNGYYNGLKTLLDHMIETGLSTKERQEGIWFAENLEQIKQILKA